METSNRQPKQSPDRRDLAGIPDILVVSHSRQHTLFDRRNLRRMRAGQALHFSSGLEAARHADSAGAHLILVDDRLDDMKGTEFVRILRLHPEHVHTPVVAMSTVHSREALGQAAQSGCSGFLVRPYSFKSFSSQVLNALELADTGGTLARLVPDAALDGTEPSREAFEKALAEHRRKKAAPPDHGYLAFKRGVEMYRTRRFGQALDDFRRALQHKPRLAEAQHGMALCWKALGFPAKYRHWLEQTVESLLLAGRLREADKVLEALSRVDGPERDIRQAIGQSLIRRGDYKGAADVFELCLEDKQAKGAIFSAMARACMFTGNPVGTARRLSDELSRREPFAGDEDLFDAILGGSGSGGLPAAGRDTRDEQAEGGRFRDMVAVAGYTVKMFRQRGAA